MPFESNTKWLADVPWRRCLINFCATLPTAAAIGGNVGFWTTCPLYYSCMWMVFEMILKALLYILLVLSLNYSWNEKGLALNLASCLYRSMLRWVLDWNSFFFGLAPENYVIEPKVDYVLEDVLIPYPDFHYQDFSW